MIVFTVYDAVIMADPLWEFIWWKWMPGAAQRLDQANWLELCESTGQWLLLSASTIAIYYYYLPNSWCCHTTFRHCDLVYIHVCVCLCFCIFKQPE